MSYRKWTYSFLLLATLLVGAVLLVNRYFDPLWHFSTAGYTGAERRPVLDERRQKTNYLNTHEPEFTNIILGSSRATYLDASALGEPWFNYAVSGMYPEEMIGFVRNAQAFTERLDTVLILLDFWTTCPCAVIRYEAATVYLNEAQNPLKIFSQYSSLDALKKSFNVYKSLNAGPNTAFYSWPELIKFRTSSYSSDRNKHIKDQLWYYEKDVYGESYHFDSNYANVLDSLKHSFPDITFVVMTSPLSPELWNLIERLGRTKDLQHWRSILRERFENFHDLSEPGKYSDQGHFYYDVHHLKSEYITALVKSKL